MQVSPSLNRTIEVVVHGETICCSKPMEEIVAVLCSAVLNAARDWTAANLDWDPAMPLPPVSLSLLPPHLLFALCTDTYAPTAPTAEAYAHVGSIVSNSVARTIVEDE